jgi:hypothetical protein
MPEAQNIPINQIDMLCFPVMIVGQPLLLQKFKPAWKNKTPLSW